MQTNLIVTDAACAYIKTKTTAVGGVGLRVSIKKTGCSGYSYVPEVATTINPNDTAAFARRCKNRFC